VEDVLKVMVKSGGGGTTLLRLGPDFRIRMFGRAAQFQKMGW